MAGRTWYIGDASRAESWRRKIDKNIPRPGRGSSHRTHGIAAEKASR
jgi:hypothetical protein